MPQIGLSVFLVANALAMTWGFAWVLGFNGGTAAGLLAGALTSSTALSAATQAIADSGVDPPQAADLAHHLASA